MTDPIALHSKLFVSACLAAGESLLICIRKNAGFSPSLYGNGSLKADANDEIPLVSKKSIPASVFSLRIIFFAGDSVLASDATECACVRVASVCKIRVDPRKVGVTLNFQTCGLNVE